MLSNGKSFQHCVVDSCYRKEELACTCPEEAFIIFINVEYSAKASDQVRHRRRVDRLHEGLGRRSAVSLRQSSRGWLKRCLAGGTSALQAACKHPASLLQAGIFSLQATTSYMASVQVLVRFRVLKCPPKYPNYNIGRGKYKKRGGVMDTCPAGIYFF